MEKLDYVRTEMEIIEFNLADVIATSAEPPAPADPYEGGGY